MTQDTDSNIQAKVWLEPEQVKALQNACYDESFASYLQQRNDAIIAVLYDTGLRVGELVQLDVNMLRDGRTALYIPAHLQKDYPTENSPTAVTMNLSGETTRTLNSYLTSRWKDTDALFPSRKADRITEQGVRYFLKEVAEVADVQPWKIDGSRGDASDVTPHALRHSVAYRMLHEEDGTSFNSDHGASLRSFQTRLNRLRHN
jgi:integrase/recombinase XerD